MRRMFSLEQLKGIADSEVKSLVEGGTLDIVPNKIGIDDDNKLNIFSFINDNANINAVYVVKFGQLIYFDVDITFVGEIVASAKIATVAENWRPTHTCITIAGGANNSATRCFIDSNGDITANINQDNGYTLHLNIVYH